MILTRLKKEQGSTVVEVLVVMAIIAILATVTLGLVTSLFDSSLRTSKYLDQNTRIETVYGFFASRMASTNIGKLGLTNDANTQIDPLTVAGDQFVFQSNGGGGTLGASLCYRLMYFKNPVTTLQGSFQANSIWAAVSSSCASVKPTIGPNGTSAQISASNDPVLDPATATQNPNISTFLLASGVSPTNSKFESAPGGPSVCGGTSSTKSYTFNLVPFSFCNATLSPVTVAETAAPGATASFYTPPDGTTAEDRLRELRAFQLTSYIDSSGGASPVPIREYTQVFTLAQVCATDTSVELTLPDPQGWREVQPYNYEQTNPSQWVATNPSLNQYWERATATQVTPAFYRDSATKRVYFRGAVKRTSDAPPISTSTATIFSLPVGSTPPPPTSGTSSQRFLVPRGDAGVTAVVEIRTSSNGTAQVIFSGASNLGSNETLYLDSISFRVN